jgi:hypothetical protein
MCVCQQYASLLSVKTNGSHTHTHTHTAKIIALYLVVNEKAVFRKLSFSLSLSLSPNAKKNFMHQTKTTDSFFQQKCAVCDWVKIHNKKEKN